MAKKNILFAALLGFVISFSTCVKQDIDYTFEINNLRWIDSGQDADKDGYVTIRNLQFSLLLHESVTRDIEVRIYYRLSETNTWIFYTSKDIPGFSGGTEVPVTIQIGLDKQLSEGNYDFLVEVYEFNKDRLEAQSSIEEAAFERLVNDQNYDLSLWWSELDDYDYDGFPKTATLNINVDVTKAVNKEIKAEVYYQLPGSEEYKRYFKSDYYTISGNKLDSISVPTGFHPDTLSHGLHNFKVIIYERSELFPVLIYDKEMSPLLKEIPFESELDDAFEYNLNTENVAWSLVIDQDGDGFAQTRVLSLDIDIDKEETVNVKAKILRRGPDDEDYLILDSTSVFSVTGSTKADLVYLPVYSTLVTDSVKMPHGAYDFMLTIFEILPDAAPDLRFGIDSINGLILQNQLFELADEDK